MAGILLCASQSMATSDLSYLQGLLSNTPAGGWVKASTTTYSSAWVPTNEMLVGTPAGIARAWASVAWDSNSGNLLLWGGGHANYGGNEMYVWKGSDGAWTRGSLPSALSNVPQVINGVSDTRYFFVTDSAAPQSSHPYDNNLFLPVNNMFMTFGGAAYNSGRGLETWNGSTAARAGPWLWDPTKADANKTGGIQGSIANPNTLGGQMWTNRIDSRTPDSTAPFGSLTNGTADRFVNGTTAYRQEDGKDVVYVTEKARCSGCAGYRDLYRYEAGDVRNGGLDRYQWVGISDWNAPSTTGAATIDSQRQLYVHTIAYPGSYPADLGVWDLTQSEAANPGANRNKPIQLIQADGSAFVMTDKYGLDYDEASGMLVLWDNMQGGRVWVTSAEYDTDGSLKSSWTVLALEPSSLAFPAAPAATVGVLGRWKYINELGAFIALNEFNSTTRDAEVWLYKPVVTVVPEAGTWAMLLAGLGVVLMRARRHRAA